MYAQEVQGEGGFLREYRVAGRMPSKRPMLLLGAIPSFAIMTVPLRR